MFRRIIKLPESRSYFLFGARGTGKSTLLRTRFGKTTCLWLDLLNIALEDQLAKQPDDLARMIEGHRFETTSQKWVVIDEVQKVPRLLDVVHRMIEQHHQDNLCFALTGSSARKLRHGLANLLAGRAFVRSLFPLTWQELAGSFNLPDLLQFGSLPDVVSLNSPEDKKEYLRSYALTYLKEEIWAEHIVRKLNPFRKFLEVAAQTDTEPVNYAAIGRDVGVDQKTVQSYYQILEDTLLGFLLEPYARSVRKRQSQRPKFYFFDAGVSRALSNQLTTGLAESTYGYGRAFERFIIIESIRAASYLRNDFRFSYLKTKDNAEIDLIIDRPGLPVALVEIKSTRNVGQQHAATLIKMLPAFPTAEAFVLSRDTTPKRYGPVWALPWQQGLTELGLTS